VGGWGGEGGGGGWFCVGCLKHNSNPTVGGSQGGTRWGGGGKGRSPSPELKEESVKKNRYR